MGTGGWEGVGGWVGGWVWMGAGGCGWVSGSGPPPTLSCCPVVLLQIDEWLVTNLPEGARVGLDPFCHTVDGLNKLKAKLEVS